jgi:hypothetical protein
MPGAAFRENQALMTSMIGLSEAPEGSRMSIASRFRPEQLLHQPLR